MRIRLEGLDEPNQDARFASVACIQTSLVVIHRILNNSFHCHILTVNCHLPESYTDVLAVTVSDMSIQNMIFGTLGKCDLKRDLHQLD